MVSSELLDAGCFPAADRSMGCPDPHEDGSVGGCERGQNKALTAEDVHDGGFREVIGAGHDGCRRGWGWFRCWWGCWRWCRRGRRWFGCRCWWGWFGCGRGRGWFGWRWFGCRRGWGWFRCWWGWFGCRRGWGWFGCRRGRGWFGCRRGRVVRVQARVGVVRLQAQVVRVQAQAVRSPRAVQEGRPARGAGEPAVHRPAVPRRPPWRVATRSPLMGPPRESPRRRSPAALAAVYRPLPVRFQNRRRQASRRRPSRPQRRTRGSFARLPPLGGFELLCRCSQVERLYRRDPGSHRRPLWLRGRRPSRAR